MSDLPIPLDILNNHTAILGKTGRGKTSTGKKIVEHLVPAGDRVCILDPVKSDWWGLTSSADGKSEGLPFQILGGPHGHVPLHPTSGAVLAELVATGALPLSIMDMKNFGPGDHSRFFIDFAEKLLNRMRGVLYLVIEEAHLFAPKERSGIGNENMAIHYAKALATAGRSTGIRLILLTQRTQALHNALIGSCETMIAHGLTAPADQKPVIDWLKANATREVASEITAELANLKRGTAWVCCGETGFFKRVTFPKITTYDNSATPTRDAMQAVEVRMAAVDVENLRTIIGDAVAEADANDPAKLKAEIAKLKSDLAKKLNGAAPPADAVAIQAAEEAAFLRGVEEGERRGNIAGQALALTRARNALDGLGIAEAPVGVATAQPPLRAAQAPARAKSEATVARAPLQREAIAALAPLESRDSPALTGPQRRVLDALAWWRAFGIDQPTNEQVGFVAGYSPTSGGFANLKGGLRSVGLVDYPAGGRLALTADGIAAAGAPALDVSRDAFHAQVRAKMSGPQLKLLDPILEAYPEALTSPRVAEIAGYSAGSGGFANLRGSLRTIGLIDYPSPGQVRAADWLFP